METGNFQDHLARGAVPVGPLAVPDGMPALGPAARREAARRVARLLAPRGGAEAGDDARDAA